ncbi:MAG: glutathione S-transferase family protein [Deltaproteobacteria bacterium]|nr:glutathione S-transferase family protein [Deltaproteobacteria bacterium]
MPTFKIIIGDKNLSSWSLRPWLALAQSGVAFDEVVVPLNQPTTKAAIAALSPNARVPALHVLTGGLGDDVVISESLAICELINEEVPAAQLWPADRVARAYARAASNEMHAGLSALRSNMPMNVCARLPGVGRAPGVQADIDRITTIWRESRARFGSVAQPGGPFLFGKFSIADAMFAPVVTRFRTYVVELDDVCQAYCDAVWALPAMKQWEAAAVLEVAPKP